MPLHRRIALIIACALAGSAPAKPVPRPPPSGITLHPFNAPGAVRVPAPVMLHRMFVTGDPAQAPGHALSHGRARRAAKTN